MFEKTYLREEVVTDEIKLAELLIRSFMRRMSLRTCTLESRVHKRECSHEEIQSRFDLLQIARCA
jgi:hypothetical protein